MIVERLKRTVFQPFPKIVSDYIDDNHTLDVLKVPSNKLSTFESAFKSRHLDTDKRQLLAESLLLQYEEQGIELASNSSVKDNVEALRQANSFTVTTGHQLCLFGGPLYFIIKILQTLFVY